MCVSVSHLLLFWYLGPMLWKTSFLLQEWGGMGWFLNDSSLVGFMLLWEPNAADLTGGRGQGVMRWGAEINTAQAFLTHLPLWGLIPTRPQQLPGLGTPALCGSRRCVCVCVCVRERERERERERRKWIGGNMFWSEFSYYDSWKCMYVWYESYIHTYIHTYMQTMDRYDFKKRFPVNLN